MIQTVEIIRVDNQNIDREHICCSLSKDDGGVAAKKDWLRERFAEGLVFQKLNARGKAFIEYIPAENAWCPIAADGYMFINCFWVSGKFKGQGYANQLLEKCIADARELGMKGLVVLASSKKKPFLSDPGYLKHKGFRVCDTAAPDFELLYLPFEGAEKSRPEFKACAKRGHIEESGVVLYYSNQCPFTAKYVPLIADAARRVNVPCRLIQFQTTQQAQNAPSPFTTYSLFYDGEFITNEILTEKKFLALLEKRDL